MSNKPLPLSRSRRLLSASLFLAIVSALPLPGRAETASAAWLDRLAHMEDLSFRGVLTYSRGDHQESLRVTHGRYSGEVYQRLEHLDGEQREVIRYGERLTCIQLGERLERLLHGHLLRSGLANLDPHYAIAVGEESRIAGRRAVALTITPRDDFRYGYRLALDYDTGLLLRSESLNHAGHVLERLQFVDVEIVSALRKEWLGDAPVAVTKPARDSLPIERVIEEGQMPWKPRWLPPGFSLALAPHLKGDNALTYSDGLAVFSIFVESAAEALPTRAGMAKQGATVAYTRPVQLAGRPQLIVVVGEVPPDTARRVANSVEWGAAEAPAADAR